MKLNDADRAFIDAIAPDHADDVAFYLASRPDRLDVICQMGEPVRSKMWRDWALLVAQVARATFRTSPAGARDTVYWERVDTEHSKRQSWLERFLGKEARPFGISMKSRIVRGLSAGRQARLLWKLAMLLMRSDALDSELSSSYVLIARTCLIAGSHAAAARAREAFVFRIYRPETAFVAAWLMQDGVKAHQVTLTTPLLPNTRAAIADDLVLCNPYQLDEIAMLSKERRWPPAALWGPQEIVELEERWGYDERPFLPDRIGMYTQGFRMRVRRGLDTDEAGGRQAEHEERLREMMLGYLALHPEVTLQVFPHPMERRWFLETGEHDLGDLVGHPQVVIDWEGPSSTQAFDRIGVGVVTFSTVGFDRVYMGFPTVFFTLPDQIDPAIESPYRALFVPDSDALHAAIDEARALTPTQWAEQHFGGRFRAPERGVTAS